MSVLSRSRNLVLDHNSGMTLADEQRINRFVFFKVNQILLVWLWDTCCLLQEASSNLTWGSTTLDTIGLCACLQHSTYDTNTSVVNNKRQLNKCTATGFHNGSLSPLGFWGSLDPSLDMSNEMSNVRSEVQWGTALGDKKREWMWRRWLPTSPSSLVCTRSWSLFSFTVSHWQEYRFGFI